MRIAALYDIHGNYQALEAVLHEVEQHEVDVTVVGGDVAWGPFPRETIDLLLAIPNATFIQGNCDREVAQRFGTTEGLDETTAAINLWAADQLSEGQLKWLSQLQPTFSAEVDEFGDVLFCHGSPRSDEEIITPLSPSERLRDALSRVSQRTIVCGHTHMQFELDADVHHVVNAGSVGLPYEGLPGAYWALLGPDVKLQRTEYDVESTAEAMRRSNCPQVEEVFVENLLHPPPALEVARHFETVAAKRTDK